MHKTNKETVLSERVIFAKQELNLRKKNKENLIRNEIPQTGVSERVNY